MALHLPSVRILMSAHAAQHIVTQSISGCSGQFSHATGSTSVLCFPVLCNLWPRVVQFHEPLQAKYKCKLSLCRSVKSPMMMWWRSIVDKSRCYMTSLHAWRQVCEFDQMLTDDNMGGPSCRTVCIVATHVLSDLNADNQLIIV